MKKEAFLEQVVANYGALIKTARINQSPFPEEVVNQVVLEFLESKEYEKYHEHNKLFGQFFKSVVISRVHRDQSLSHYWQHKLISYEHHLQKIEQIQSESEASRLEFSHLLFVGFKQLTELQQILFCEWAIEGKTIAEIAKEKRMGKDRVREMLRTAREILQTVILGRKKYNTTLKLEELAYD